MLKYGAPVERLLEHRERLLEERRELEAVEDRLAVASAAAREALEAYDRAARDLERNRRRAGRELLAEVARVLGDLRMGGTLLELSWQPRPDPGSPLVRDGRGVAFGPDGVEECELLIAPNPGEELRPMARIASGGELSRIHLALRTALRARHPSAGLTLLFDEVDSGLGGGTATALAGLLASLAATDQVLVVTHLPQVAARAASHFRVEKVVEAGRAVTRVARLDGDGRELELARMLGSEEPSDTARAHARDLLGRR
jgi:DNA repair protein RecN (Recombination protein N)